MKLMPIFVDDETKEGLYAIVYDENNGIDEFERIFTNWSDVEYLTDYCVSNEEYLEDDYFDSLSKDQIIDTILEESEELQFQIEKYANEGFAKDGLTLQSIFKPLYNKQYTLPALQESKAKVLDNRKYRNPILRVYGLRIGANCFVVTGGAIKITQFMDQHKDTENELIKIKKVKDFLKANDISFEEDLLNFYSDES